MLIRISQCDPRWGSKKIGKSKTTVCKAGCLLTALTMAVHKIIPDSKLTPAYVAFNWDFVKQGDDPEPHYLSWETDFKPWGFKAFRYYTFYPNMVKLMCTDKEVVVVMHLLHRQFHHHHHLRS